MLNESVFLHCKPINWLTNWYVIKIWFINYWFVIRDLGVFVLKINKEKGGKKEEEKWGLFELILILIVDLQLYPYSMDHMLAKGFSSKNRRKMDGETNLNHF